MVRRVQWNGSKRDDSGAHHRSKLNARSRQIQKIKKFPPSSIQIIPPLPLQRLPLSLFSFSLNCPILLFLSLEALFTTINLFPILLPPKWRISWCLETRSWKKIMTPLQLLRTLNRSRQHRILATGSSNLAKRTPCRRRPQIRTSWHRRPQPRWRVHSHRAPRSSGSSASSLWHPRIVWLLPVH